MSSLNLAPHLLINAYCQGIFPMASEGEIYWFDPDPRAVIPLDRFHVSRSLRRVMKRVWVPGADDQLRPFFDDLPPRADHQRLEIRLDSDFEAVIAACADPSREGGWINRELMEAYINLHQLGWAHSVETWQAGRLIGGLYGVAIRGFFAGESMFSHESNASKVALVYLVSRLKARNFALLDVQFHTPHLSQFGAVEIPRQEYRRRLMKALTRQTNFV